MKKARRILLPRARSYGNLAAFAENLALMKRHNILPAFLFRAAAVWSAESIFDAAVFRAAEFSGAFFLPNSLMESHGRSAAAIAIFGACAFFPVAAGCAGMEQGAGAPADARRPLIRFAWRQGNAR